MPTQVYYEATKKGDLAWRIAQRVTGWSRGEHQAEARAVEAHQEAKHGDV